ncbi:MAG: hypothetical protein F2813_03060 [Actinobacteria bacterium]|uniref:Unannotated protein n=1 Tax=freshwater metagenome TaxID=449393 RepID=A0A6J5ZJQ0_9ZZZZ|nr:hypothetical protein [Actinomycetota bacterium]
MTTTERLFEDFRAAFERGERPNLGDLLESVSADQRAELEQKIERYLVDEAPLRSYDATAFAAEQQTPLMESAAEIFSDAFALQPSRARERAGLSIEELAEQVLVKTGMADDAANRSKATRYLEQLEAGTLPRLGSKVREALRSVLGAEVILAVMPAPPQSPGIAFRASLSDQAPPEQSVQRAEMIVDALSVESPADWDEVDDLFLSAD